MKIVWPLFFVFILVFGVIDKVYCESNVMITEVAGIKTPDIPLGDEFRPDVVLDPSLAGDINIDISTTNVPDGTTVKIKFRDEDNSNPPHGIVENGMVTIPVTLEAGNVKVLYAETDSYYTELASFLPTDDSGLKLWLKADDGAKAVSMAANFLRYNNQYLSIPDNPSISLESNQDFSIALWVNLGSKYGSWGQSFINKDNGTGRGEPIEYGLGYGTRADRFRFILGNGSSYGYVDANGLGVPEINKWYFVVAWHDSEKDTLNIQVNNGEIDSTPWSGGTLDSSGPLLIGDGYRNFQNDPEKFYFDGKLQGISFWKKVLASEERASLYNLGSGKLYSDLLDDEKDSLISFWNLSEENGARVDAHGTNDLTQYNGIFSTKGIVSGKADGEQSVERWIDKSGNNNNFLQETKDFQPIFKADLLNGKGAVNFDGLDDKLLALSSITDLTQKLTAYFVASPDILHNGTIWSTEGADSGDGCLLLNGGSDQKFSCSYPLISKNTGVSENTPSYYTAVFSSTNFATGTIKLRANGKDIGTSTSGKRSATHNGNLVVGSKTNGSNPFDGNIYELILFEGEHTLKQIAEVEGYLKEKYGL
ncbi:MAG: LamG domain-containing protein [Candidatus Melainabacteria bacterium]|nr:LamG domain-containing protein [Candidatus Melainabacteria bacterium]